MVYLSINDRFIDAFIRGVLHVLVLSLLIGFIYLIVFLISKAKKKGIAISVKEFIVEQAKIIYNKAKTHTLTTIVFIAFFVSFITLFIIVSSNNTLKAHRIIKKELKDCEIIHFGPLEEYDEYKTMNCFFCSDNGYSTTTFLFDDECSPVENKEDFCASHEISISHDFPIYPRLEAVHKKIKDIDKQFNTIERDNDDLGERVDEAESDITYLHDVVSDLEEKIYW